MELERKITKRIYWIDLAKIIAMILVITTHTIAYSQHLRTLYKYISSFHVPLFFLISGLTFNVKQLSYKEFFKKKFRTIVVPYLFWGIIFLLPYLLLGNNVSESLGINMQNNGLKQVIGIIYGNGHDGFLKQNTSLWFLTCLFIVENIYFFVENCKNRNKYLFTIIIGAILGGLDYYYLPIRLPWGVDIAIVMLVFFSIGRILATYFKREKIVKGTNIKQCGYAVILILIGGFIQLFNTSVGCVNRDFGNYIIFLLSAIVSCVGYVYIIKNLPYSSLMQYAGQRTLAILIFHKIPIIIFQTRLGKITRMLKNSNIYIELLISILIITISIIFSLFVEKIIIKYCPNLLGMQRRKASLENEKD